MIKNIPKIKVSEQTRYFDLANLKKNLNFLKILSYGPKNE